jgi:Zn-finger protein
MMFFLMKWAVRICSLGFLDLDAEYVRECSVCGLTYDDNEEELVIRHLQEVHGMKTDRYGNIYFEETKWKSGEFD